MKKYASIIMALLLCMSVSVTAFARGMDNFKPALQYAGFSDVAEGAWYHGSVKAAFEYGLIKGASPTEFQPDGSLTVAEAIVMADRIHMLYETGGDTLVNGTPWYQTYVDYAIENGIIAEGDFDGYDRSITRGEMADIFTRALPGEEYEVINDIPDELPLDIVDHKYEDSIRTLFRAGIVTGNDPYGTYTPDEGIKRCEAAAIISRIVDESLRKRVELLVDTEVDENITVAAHHDSHDTYFELDETNVEIAVQIAPGQAARNGTIIVYRWKERAPMTAEQFRSDIAGAMNADPAAVKVAEVMFGSAKAYRYDVKVKANGAYLRLAGYTIDIDGKCYEIHGSVVYGGDDIGNAEADRLLCDMMNNVKVRGSTPSAKLAD